MSAHNPDRLEGTNMPYMDACPRCGSPVNAPREKAYAALLAAAEEILPACIDEWGRDDPEVEALIRAVKTAKGEAENSE